MKGQPTFITSSDVSIISMRFEMEDKLKSKNTTGKKSCRINCRGICLKMSIYTSYTHFPTTREMSIRRNTRNR